MTSRERVKETIQCKETYTDAVQQGHYALYKGGLSGKHDNVRTCWEVPIRGQHLRPHLQNILRRKRRHGEKVRIADLGAGSGEALRLMTTINIDDANLQLNQAVGNTGSSSGNNAEQPASSLSNIRNQGISRTAVYNHDPWTFKVPDLPAEEISDRLEKSKSMISAVTGRPGTVYVSSLPSGNDLVLRSIDTAAIEQIKEVIKRLDKPRAQVLLEVKVLDVKIDDEHARGIDWLFNTHPGGDTYHTITGSWFPEGTTTDPRAVVFGYLTDEVEARIRLMEEKGKITRLATPNLLVADNEASRVFVGTEIKELTELPNRTETTTSVESTTETTGAEISKRDIGTTLLITPKIHADRTVTIRILQEDSTLGQERLIQYGSSDQTITTQDIERRSLTTTVVASDGNILAVGGLVREGVEHRVRGIPVIHRLPIFGELFRSTRKVQSRHELMVLIRPFILLAPGDGKKISNDFLKRISRHPSARNDLPDLGVVKPEDIPVGKYRKRIQKEINTEKERARIWSWEK